MEDSSVTKCYWKMLFITLFTQLTLRLNANASVFNFLLTVSLTPPYLALSNIFLILLYAHMRSMYPPTLRVSSGRGVVVVTIGGSVGHGLGRLIV